jgi:hypothetical protein
MLMGKKKHLPCYLEREIQILHNKQFKQKDTLNLKAEMT